MSQEASEGNSSTSSYEFLGTPTRTTATQTDEASFPEVTEVSVQPAVQPVRPPKAKAKAQQVLSREDRIARAAVLGVSDHFQLIQQPSDCPEFQELSLKNRYWCSLHSGRCSHTGITDRWSVAFQYLCGHSSVVKRNHPDFRQQPDAVDKAFPSPGDARVLQAELPN